MRQLQALKPGSRLREILPPKLEGRLQVTKATPPRAGGWAKTSRRAPTGPSAPEGVAAVATELDQLLFHKNCGFVASPRALRASAPRLSMQTPKRWTASPGVTGLSSPHSSICPSFFSIDTSHKRELPHKLSPPVCSALDLWWPQNLQAASSARQPHLRRGLGGSALSHRAGWTSGRIIHLSESPFLNFVGVLPTTDRLHRVNPSSFLPC